MSERIKIRHWLIIALLSIIWGTSYILMKKGLEYFSIYQIGSLRIIITAVCLLPVSIRHLALVNRKNIVSIAVIGLFGSGIPAFLFPLAQTRIDSSLAGMLNSLSPAFTLIFGIILYRKKVIKSQVAGVFLGLIGAAGLLYSGSFTFNFYGLFVVLATILYGISSNEVSRVQNINGIKITALAFFFLLPMGITTLLITGLHPVNNDEEWIKGLFYIAVLSVAGSALALALFYYLIRETSPVFASMTTYLIPIVATLWGILDGERLLPSMLVSVLIILAGVYLINRPSFREKIKRMMQNMQLL